MLFLPSCIRQLINLLTSFEPYRGSGRSWALLAVNLRAMRASWESSMRPDEARKDEVWGPGLRCVYFFLAGAALFLGAPYFERACLRSATPRLSSTPRTTW